MNGRWYSEPLRIVQAGLGVVVRSLLVLEEVSPAPGALRGEQVSNHQWMRMPVSVERASAVKGALPRELRVACVDGIYRHVVLEVIACVLWSEHPAKQVLDDISFFVLQS